MAGFHFSSINHAMTSENPSDSINLFWNQQMEKNKANASLFLTPNFDPTIGFEYPEFGTFGNNLLNPMLAIQQTMQSFQNGSWMMGSNYAGGFNFPGFNNIGGFGNLGFGSPWGNFQSPWTRQDGQGGSGATAADKEYNKLKKALTEYKKSAEAMGDNELVDKINSALNKSGKVDEKLSAIKELCKSLDPTKMQNALLATDPYKADLIKIGYKVSNNDADKDLQRRIEAAYTEIDTAGGTNKLCANVLSGEDDPEILKKLSFWNDKHNKTSDKSMLRAIAPKIPNKKEDQTDYKKVVDCVTNSLISYSVRVKQNYDGTDFTNLDKSVDEVTKALKAATDNLNKTTVNKLADKVEDLYARLRLIEAERVRNNIQKDYNFINNYFTNKSVIDDNLVVSETKKDLTSEGIKIPTNTDVIPTNRQEVAPSTDLDNKPVDEQISELTTNSKDLHERATKKGKVYYSNKGDNEPAQWYMKDGDKLVQLKGVTSIDANGKCTMKSGAPTDLDKLSEDNKVEVLPSEIKQYNATLKQIKDYSGRLIKCPTTPQNWKNAGVTLYWSKGTINGEDGKPHCQCFVVIDNKLQKIDNAYVDKQGVIRFFNGETLDVKDLTSAHCTPVTSIDEIQLTNEPKSTSGATTDTTTGTTTGAKGNFDNSVLKLSEDDLKLREAIVKTAQEENGAYDLGYQTADDLIGVTNDEEYSRVKVTLTGINSENVIDFLKGYYANDGGGNGFFLQLGLESTHFKNKFVVPVIKAFLDAVPTEFRASDEFKTAQRIYRKCATRGDEKDFKNFSWGWGWDRIWGIDELDQLDDAIEELLSQMKDNSSNETKTE